MIVRAGVSCLSVREQDFGRAIFKNHVGDWRIGDIANLLGGHDNRGIFSAHGLQPIFQPTAEEGMLEV